MIRCWRRRPTRRNSVITITNAAASFSILINLENYVMSPQQLSLHFVSFLILSYFPSPSCCFGKFSGTEASPSETFWGLLFLSQLFGHIFSLYLAVFEFDVENLGVLSGVLLHTVVLIRISSNFSRVGTRWCFGQEGRKGSSAQEQESWSLVCEIMAADLHGLIV